MDLDTLQAAFGSALNTRQRLVLAPGQIVDAIVLSLLKNGAFRLAIADAVLDLNIDLPLEKGARLQLAVEGERGALKLTPLPETIVIGPVRHSLPPHVGKREQPVRDVAVRFTPLPNAAPHPDNQRATSLPPVLRIDLNERQQLAQTPPSLATRPQRDLTTLNPQTGIAAEPALDPAIVSTKPSSTTTLPLAPILSKDPLLLWRPRSASRRPVRAGLRRSSPISNRRWQHRPAHYPNRSAPRRSRCLPCACRLSGRLPPMT